jgi:hypothetical protein
MSDAAAEQDAKHCDQQQYGPKGEKLVAEIKSWAQAG